MKTKLTVVKIGGNVINNEKALDAFLTDFALLKGPKILIHGGGNLATDMSKKLGMEPKLSNGRRITTKDDLEIVTMVYAGLLNKKIVSQLQAKKCNALGLSGADGNSVASDKRPVEPIDYGYVGDVKSVNTEFIDTLISNNLIPVFCAITHDQWGQLLNTNADTMAAEIAIAMSQSYRVDLIYCFEKQGVLADANDDTSVITHVNWNNYLKLIDSGIIQNGMLPKMQNCFHALKGNVSKVIIGSPDVLKSDCNLYTTITLQ